MLAQVRRGHARYHHPAVNPAAIPRIPSVTLGQRGAYGSEEGTRRSTMTRQNVAAMLDISIDEQHNLEDFSGAKRTAEGRTIRLSEESAVDVRRGQCGLPKDQRRTPTNLRGGTERQASQ